MLTAAPHLPHPFVGFPPAVAEPVEHALQVLPDLVVEGCAVLVVEIGRVQDGPEGIELELGVGSVAKPHWA